MKEFEKITPLTSYELGKDFTWANPDQPNQRGWVLNQEIRSKIADGTIKHFLIAIDAATLKSDGGMAGLEVSVNSENNGFCMDYKSFPWNWDTATEKGGYVSYAGLLAGGYATVDSGVIYLKYHITSHPHYSAFKKEMSSAEWGEISIQYGIGIRILPFVNAYLQG